MKLYCVFLGGNAANSNTELHDVVIAAGNKIEDTYMQLLDKWFGSPDGLHIDSWYEVNNVDGYDILLNKKYVANDKKLYFVNTGAYNENIFGELHAYTLIVAGDIEEAKNNAKQNSLQNTESIHTDNIVTIDNCIVFNETEEFFIELKYTGNIAKAEYHNEYQLIPQDYVMKFKRKK